MRCVDATNPNSQPFDIPSGLARILINQKLVVEYQAPKPVLLPATFGVGSYTDGKPFVIANCDTCHMKWRYEGPNPKAMQVQHCKMTDQVPADVIAEYLEAYRTRTWEGKEPAQARKFESRPAEHVSSF